MTLQKHLETLTLQSLKQIIREHNLHTKIKLGQKKEHLIQDICKHYDNMTGNTLTSQIYHISYIEKEKKKTAKVKNVVKKEISKIIATIAEKNKKSNYDVSKLIIPHTDPPEKKTIIKVKKIKVKKDNDVDSDTDDETDKIIRNFYKNLPPNNVKKEPLPKTKPKPAPIEPDSDDEEEPLKLNNISIDVLNEIDKTLKFLKTGRINFHKEDNEKIFDSIKNAIGAYDFYPTPEIYSEKIYKLETTTYSLDNAHILDVGCGLLSLSLPFIKNAKSGTKIDLIEMNPAFNKIIKPLENKNINIYNDDFFDIPDETFFNKDIDIILSNPPFAGTAENDRTKLLYFYFLKKIINIAMHQNVETHIYFICPKTYFDSNSGQKQKLKEGDVFSMSNVLPKKTEKDINKFLNYNWTFYDDFSGQVRFLGDVTGFRTLRKGKPVDMKMIVGLFEFIVR